MTVTKWGNISSLDRIPAECPHCKTQVLLSESEIMQRTGAGLIRYRCPLCGGIVDALTASPAIRAAQRLTPAIIAGSLAVVVIAIICALT